MQGIGYVLSASEPAGGAALDQVIIATAGAFVACGTLLWALLAHRRNPVGLLSRAAAYTERVSALPAWAALPSFVSAVSLYVALLGMYWDISLHIDVGRDPGPLANPAHYLILAGLFGIFAAGVLALGLPGRNEIPGATAVRLGPGWHAPIGGLLMAGCAAFALLGFPLDDMWHRMFGQDVTLWGPTHLMLIGGAGMTLIGQAVLLVEGVRARSGSRKLREGAQGVRASLITALRRVALMGGLLIGLSTFQAEFDFGVPQFRMVLQPLLIAVAAAVALVAARLWIGRGGAIAAALFFLGSRGVVALIDGDVFGEAAPHMPLYLGEAVAVELAGLALARRSPLAFGAVAGALVGTVGLLAEWGWTEIAMPLPWNGGILPEAAIVAPVGAIAGGVLGALIGTALNGTLPRPPVARTAFAVSMVAIMACVANGLVTETPTGMRAAVSLRDVKGPPQREANATVRLQPAGAADDAAWLTVTAWQGGGLVVSRLEHVGDGVYRSTQPVPVYGDWKALIRLHEGRALLGAPVYLPEDSAIPGAKEVPARAQFTRPLTSDKKILQRETKPGVSPVLKTGAPLAVMVFALGFIGMLAWGLARIGTPPAETPRPQRDERTPRREAVPTTAV